MGFMSNMSTNLKRDLAFIGLALFVVLGIWCPAWEAPSWQYVVFYGLGAVFLIPAVAYGRELGFDSLAMALVPAICIGLMMIGAIGQFIWEFFLRN